MTAVIRVEFKEDELLIGLNVRMLGSVRQMHDGIAEKALRLEVAGALEQFIPEFRKWLKNPQGMRDWCNLDDRETTCSKDE